MRKQHRAQQGFTLIELMIVIAIVGILAAIALPAYQDYTVRARLSEVLAVAAEGKTTIAEFVAATGALPSNAAAAGITTSGFGTQSFVQAAAFTDDGGNQGTYTLTVSTLAGAAVGGAVADGGAAGGTVSLRATVNPASRRVDWACGPGATGGVPAKFLPATCRTAL
ncbi:MAG: pilin [Pseudomonadota bacterium]